VIDILYVAYCRLEMTKASFQALLDYTDWTQVVRLFINHDAGDDDGTWEWLSAAASAAPVPVVRRYQGTSRGPVAAMNWYLDHPSEEDCYCRRVPDCWRCHGTGRATVEQFAKVDNDFVVCPGWLGELLRVTSENPEIDILGTEPMLGPPLARGTATRGFETARWIGGKGLIRHRAFDHCRPTPGGWNGYQGFTQWQQAHPDVVKAWIRPELCTFGLDQLPLEPWRSLADEYEAAGWQRRWPEYAPDQERYWSWWLEASA
jgi:hypothetical protein